MQTHTIGRGLALVAGVGFTLGSLDILLGDVLATPASWTHHHALTALLVFGTAAVGHLCGSAWRSRAWLAVLGFAVLFVVGATIVVASSAGRQAMTSATAELSAKDVNARRAAAEVRLTENEAMLADERKAHAKEAAKGGCKGKCQGIEASIRVYEDAVNGAKAELEKLGPARPVNPEAAYVGKLAAALGFDEVKVIALYLLLMPFAKTVFFELGIIISFGYAFRHGPAEIVTPARADTAQSSFALDIETPEPTPPRGPRRKAPTPATNVVAFPVTHPVIAALEQRGGTIASNNELAAMMGVNPGEATKRVDEVLHRVERRKIGKRVEISLRRSA